MAEGLPNQGHVNRVSEALRGFVESGLRGQLIPELRAIELLGRDGAKFSSGEVVLVSTDFSCVCEGESARDNFGIQVSRDLVFLRAKGVVFYSPTDDTWRLSMAGRLAIGSIIGGDK